VKTFVNHERDAGMATYKELQTQIAELQRQAQEARANEVKAAIAQIQSIMSELGIAAADLEFWTAEKGQTLRSKSTVKYRDGENTWSGRGRMPLWLKDKDKEKFRVG
jgi:DNA-binding protein H-NS